MVQRALPTWSASESESQLPEITQVLCIECPEAQATKTTEEKVGAQDIC
jgi:hypothetical protein